MEETDDARAELWYSYPLVGDDLEVEVRLARPVGGDEVSVKRPRDRDGRTGAPGHTLLTAFARG
ncbi:hypothetical protein ABTX85_16245 [Streptomyces sp. NPDC096097]|uniref:hypothetical protein n=1 Tax=Streptomyces sp. NPDC096097 TaxID=3155546 RepID=UPI003325903D